jgi:DNA-binding CsgD family transcriptional regulator
MLFGRDSETQLIDELLDGARDGRSGVLVVSGGAGIGKTALMRYAKEQAADLVVLRGSGIETEAELPFAGLHLILRPLLDRLGDLPRRQADALRRAFRLTEADPADGDDRFLVGLAVLTLLAEEAPLLCLVDDAHWLDAASADALLFAARRLEAEGVVLLIGTRDEPGTPWLLMAGQAECRLRALSAEASRGLVDELAPGLSPMLRERVLVEAGGNPLALCEIARTLVAGGANEPGPLPAGDRVQQVYAARIAALGEQSRLMLLVAAAEAGGDLAVVLAAARRLGTGVAELAPAERAGLVTVTGDAITFRHPLVRAAVYYGAPLAQRQAAHGALAAVLRERRGDDADRLAWHLAASITGEDETVAAGLEEAAERAKERGAHAVAASAYERAARLTPEPRARAWRLVKAAAAANDVGRLDSMNRLADAAGQLCDDPLLRAEITRLRMVAYPLDWRRYLPGLITAAAAIRDEHPRRYVELYALVLHRELLRGGADLPGDVIPALIDLASRPGLVRPADRAMIEYASLALGYAGAGRPDNRPYLAAIRTRAVHAMPRERIVAGNLAFRAGDHDTLVDISAALATECRQTGMAGWLSGALSGLALGQVLRGDWAEARASAAEGLRLAGDVGQPGRAVWHLTVLSLLDALAGDEQGCRGWIAQAADLVGQGQESFKNDWTVNLGVLDIGYGRFGDAMRRMESLRDWNLDTRFVFEPDMVEASARSGELDRAREALAGFEPWASYTGQPWALAVAARCRGLVSPPEHAGQHYAEALRLHDGAGRPFEEARTQLVYGEWLRREKRRTAAREHLQDAFSTFDRLGAKSWAQRARRELRATGLVASPVPEPVPLARLTPQEFQIVKLAAQGASNRDIAAQMFLSHRTVGYHLYKAFPKLGVASRHELATLFA